MQIKVRPSWAAPAWAARRRCIFVIETDEIVRSALQFMLYGSSEARAFTSLSQAYASAAMRKPDLILLGLSTVESHGLGVLREIAGRLPGAKILVVADSQDEPLARACLCAGADGVLGKPIAAAPVSRKISDLLDAGSRP